MQEFTDNQREHLTHCGYFKIVTSVYGVSFYFIMSGNYQKMMVIYKYVVQI